MSGPTTRQSPKVTANGGSMSRLQSAADILRKIRTISDDVLLNHMFVFAYLPQARSAQQTAPWSYDVQHLPTFAGWRSGWIEVIRFGSVAGIDSVVLICKMHWHDGSVQECYITGDGNLVMHLHPEPSARFIHAEFTASAAVPAGRERTSVSVSHDLTSEEITSGSRGLVHGSVCSPNNDRKVSHVVGIDKDDLVACAKFKSEGASTSFVRLPPGRIRKYAPELIREYQWRIKERWSADEARTVLSFLSALFIRASENDTFVREQMNFMKERLRGSQTPKEADAKNENMDALGKFAESLDATLR